MTSPVQIITMSRHESPADSFSGHEPAPSDDGSWHYMDIPSDASSVALQGSPASGSLASYGIILHRGHGHRGPSHSPAMNQSPEALPPQIPPTSSPSQLIGDRQAASYTSSSYLASQMPLSLVSRMSPAIDVPNMATSTYANSQFTSATSETSDALQQQMIRDTLLMGMDTEYTGLTGFYSDGLAPPNITQPALQAAQNQTQQQQYQQSPPPSSFDISAHLSANNNASAWDSTSIPAPQQAQQKFIPHDLMSKPIPTRSAPTSINKVRGTGTRITKKKTASQSSSLQLSGSHGSSSGDDKFVIFTPKTISTHTGNGNRFNPFECFEAMSASQKGRKGPLAEEVKESALQVRRAGACFCCHSRKVKCDAQLPCKNCIKLATHMPQAICWRFDDFLGPLFPSMIREHFEKAKMAAFISENVGSYSNSGPFTINLCSGPAFKTSLEIRNVKFFDPAPRAIVMQHTRLTTGGGQAHLSSENSIPLGLDLSENSAVSASLQQEKIKKALRAYVEGILKEDTYVETMTGNVTQTEVPRKVLEIVRAFWLKTSAPIVKQALYIYTLQYLMMHHLTLTTQTLQSLPIQGNTLSDSPFQTARLLNRQIKAIVDEMMQEDVDKLFRMFARELKPKARTAWATCLAAFLVFCMFMEMTGLSIDYFVIADNEAKIQNHAKLDPRHKRATAIKMSRELENLPFRQFALQFHNIYQTHQAAPISSNPNSSPPSSSSSTSPGAPSIKAAFNPLLDDGPLCSGDLDRHANEFVKQLRTLINGDNWHELDFLSFNNLIDTNESYPMPRDVSMDYTGRLCSKFLLSFQRESYIYTPA
ncbi:fungal zn binuclear cluster domain containing protein [Ophiostoma piceae UAMH 11346]|uniref:Fungal zn binuclear cluster domain containing protein n=1 Tax=Ophiostoma piceae (strain UAMH 11346) TaxID=1262450 RepID=S3BRT8_OPHP1|nr:fungal zn binuclear cluster domain containing protein [Ophiostoma piceae UAMH 11346]